MVALVLLLLAPIATADQDPLTDLLYPDPAPYDEIPVPWDLSVPPGEHVVLHVQVTRPVTGDPTVVFALEDPGGALLMYAVADGGQIHVTDGYEADGLTPRPLVTLPGFIGEAWFRVDVTPQGATYTVEVDGTHEAGARSFSPASEARLADPGGLHHGPGHDADDIAIAWVGYLPASASTSTYNEPLAGTPWGTFRSDHGAVEAQVGLPGFGSAGRLVVDSQLHPVLPGTLHLAASNLAYARHPVPAHGGAYLIDGWARPRSVSALDLHGVPDHQTVFAGLSGPLAEPTVHWAVAMAQHGADPAQWALFLIGPDGSRTQLSPIWNPLDPWWHRVSLLVDEQVGTLTVQVDGSADVRAFGFGGLGTAEYVAIGDVWLDHPHWTGAGVGYYDNVAVVPWGTP